MSSNRNKKANEFFQKFVALCKQYGLALQSDDPYCGLNIVNYKEMKDYYTEWLNRNNQNEIEG